jgi:hypothetical protein
LKRWQGSPNGLKVWIEKLLAPVPRLIAMISFVAHSVSQPSIRAALPSIPPPGIRECLNEQLATLPKTPQTSRGSPARVNFVQISDCDVDGGRKIDLARGFVVFSMQPDDLGGHEPFPESQEKRWSVSALNLGLKVINLERFKYGNCL